MNLLHANVNRLDVQRRELRDLKAEAWAVVSEYSRDATKGLRPFKSRSSLRCISNLYIHPYIIQHFE